jgi:sugar phosphate isomerase/epimerase
MSLSQLPLSYCTNVHAGRTVAEVEAGLDRYAVPIQARFGQPLAAGLWLAKSVVSEMLSTPDGVTQFAVGLARRGLTCHTLNAFPYGDFHSERVKENVYLPDWTTDDRLQYTLQCAKVLAELLPDAGEGSISTLPLGFKMHPHPPDFLDQSAKKLIEAARSLEKIYQQTGKRIRLAVEPEPLCVLETTPEAIEFFHLLNTHAQDAGVEEAVRDHIGLCYDICHQAVEFEDVAESIRELDGADIRINKVHISCALQLDKPATNVEGREALRRYAEPRYLHQTTARVGRGKVLRETDLTEDFISNPPPAFADAPAWRIHFHVPVNAHHMGPLSTTRADLIMALTEVAGLSYAPDLEVETYTWEVLPGAQSADLVEGLAKELTSTAKLIGELDQPGTNAIS